MFVIGSGSLVKIAEGELTPQQLQQLQMQQMQQQQPQQQEGAGWVAPAAVIGGATIGGLGMRALNFAGRAGTAAYGIGLKDKVALPEGGVRHYITHGTPGKGATMIVGTKNALDRFGRGSKIIGALRKAKPFMIGAGMIGGGLAAYNGLKKLVSGNKAEQQQQPAQYQE